MADTVGPAKLYRCLYTAQKLKKRKAWSDGVLKVNVASNSCTLYSLNSNYEDIYNGAKGKTSLREMCSKMLEHKQLTGQFELSGILSGTLSGIEFENYLVDEIEGEEEAGASAVGLAPAAVAPVQPFKPLVAVRVQGGAVPLKKFKVPTTVAPRPAEPGPHEHSLAPSGRVLDASRVPAPTGRFQDLINRPVRNIDYGNVAPAALSDDVSGGPPVPFARDTGVARDVLRSSGFSAPKKYSFAESELDDIWGDGDDSQNRVEDLQEIFHAVAHGQGDDDVNDAAWGPGEPDAAVQGPGAGVSGRSDGGSGSPSSQLHHDANLPLTVQRTDAELAVLPTSGGGDGPEDWDSFDPDNFTVQTI
jgi:hypothetical protein